MPKTITVEGDLTTVDTLVHLTAQGSVVAASRTVPAGMNKIDKILVAVAPDMAAVGSGVFIIKLSGEGVLGGDQTFVVGACGGQAVQAGADPAGIEPCLAVIENVDIAVKAGNQVSVYADMTGQDLGTARIVVTLVFA